MATIIRPGKYLQHPWATEAEWNALNPILKNGEEGYAMVEVNGINHLRKKVGPGQWSALEYFDGVVWEDAVNVANPIGDAQGNLAGKTPIEIIDLMLNPYQAPVVGSAQNDGGTGSYAGTKVIEIGNSISNAVQVSYAITNQDRLSGTNPITVTAGGRFTNEGSFPNTSPISLTHSGFNPTALDLITISIQAAHQNGNSNIATTRLQFDPKIISAVAQTKVLDANAIMALPNKTYNITRDYTRDYSFGSAGHSVVCIPVMLGISNPVFSDVTDPNSVQGYAVDDLGVMSINNGVGIYDYQVYASTYYLLNSTILRIS